MNAFWDLLLSPAGLALYAGFWALKLTFGAWVLTRLVAFLPLRAQARAEQTLMRLRLKRRTGPLG